MSIPYTCDCCDKEIKAEERHFAVTPRPSDPTELVCVMYSCKECAPQIGAMSWEEVDAYFEANQYPKGNLVFNSVR